MAWWNRANGAAFLCLFLLGSAAVVAREPWIILKDCRLEENQSNDADSFHVIAGSKEYIFRLYFADAPETDASFPERVAEQAKYFGATPTQTVQLGRQAEKFAKEKLARPFTVRTCKQDAMGRSKKERFYAFVETADGDLAELLIANGLARVHGRAAAPEGLSSAQGEWLKLQRLEREAKAQKVGGWGAAAGRMTTRLPTTPAKGGADSFDAFFHPERVGNAAETSAANTLSGSTKPPLTRTDLRSEVVSDSPATGTPTSKLDVNTATSAELMNVRGVGPVLAQRILDARPFKSANDLRQVKGIGAKIYEKIRPFFIDAAGTGIKEAHP